MRSSERVPVSIATVNYSCNALTMRTSRNVKLDCQSFFKVSTQTLPVFSSTFGCHIRVRNEAFGGFLGSPLGS